MLPWSANTLNPVRGEPPGLRLTDICDPSTMRQWHANSHLPSATTRRQKGNCVPSRRSITRSFARSSRSSCFSNRKAKPVIVSLCSSQRRLRHWELRFGPDNRFRVLYGIDHERREVQIQAIGVKKGNRLFVAGEEVEL